MKVALLLTLCLLVAGCTSSPSTQEQQPTTDTSSDQVIDSSRPYEESSWFVGKNKQLADWDVKVLTMGQDPRGFRADVSIKNIPATWDTFYFINASLTAQQVVHGRAYANGNEVDSIRFQGFENRTITLIFPIAPTTPTVRVTVGTVRYPGSDNWAEFTFLEERPV